MSRIKQRLVVLNGGRAGTIDPSALAYFNVAGITSSTERAAANTCIRSLKNSGLWTALDWVYLVSPTSKAASLICAKTLVSLTEVGTITHSANGWSLPGNASNYLRTAAAVNTLPNYTNNSAGFSVYIRSSGTSVFESICGNSQAWVRKLDTTQWVGNIMSLTNLNSVAQPLGLVTVSRTGASAQAMYFGAASVASNSGASTGRGSNAFAFGGQWNGSILIEPLQSEVSAFYLGAGLTAAQVSTLNTINQAYQTALGRAV